MQPTITLKWLEARAAMTEDGCMVWKCGCAGQKRADPRATLGQVEVNVRRAVWEMIHEIDMGKFCASTSCKTPKCVHPDHIVRVTKRQLLAGRKKPLGEIARRAATRRKNSKVPQERIPDIIVDPRPGREVAAEWGISKDMVNRIRAGKNRRDYSSPFAGLGARP